jgi:SAM-dependent methyltransferase
VLFVETDLQRSGLAAGAYDVVYSSGVLHHTPNPRASFARLVSLARPGGTIVLGVYNAFARLPLRLRRLIARLSAFRFVPFDPVLRDRSDQPERREAWLRDQYRHPEEHRHTLAEVQAWFAENGVEYLRAYPSAVLGDEPQELFARATDNWRAEGWIAQLGWMQLLGHEGGLFFTVGVRR